MSPEDEVPPRAPRYLYWVFGACVSLWLLWGASFLAASAFKLGGWPEFGQFGDTFGAINALFTALAFAAFWWTGWMQQEELKLQREELRNQRFELASTKEVFKRQTFETAFFNQLELFRQVSSSVHVYGRDGREAIEFIAGALTKFIASNAFSDPNSFRDALVGKFESEYYSKFEATLGPYFRTLYHIFKLIHRQEALSLDEKVEYANIARAQLGAEALVILSANALSSRAAEFVPLIEQYGILKHLPMNDISKNLFSQCIKPIAFMSKDERALL
jgi:hypothetical protein